MFNALDERNNFFLQKMWPHIYHHACHIKQYFDYSLLPSNKQKLRFVSLFLGQKNSRNLFFRSYFSKQLLICSFRFGLKLDSMEIKSESDLDFDTCDKIENMQQSFRTKWRGFSTILTALAAFYLPFVGQSEDRALEKNLWCFKTLSDPDHDQSPMTKAMTMSMTMTITSPEHSKL